jgi:hypothetical protein
VQERVCFLRAVVILCALDERNQNSAGVCASGYSWSKVAKFIDSAVKPPLTFSLGNIRHTRFLVRYALH